MPAAPEEYAPRDPFSRTFRSFLAKTGGIVVMLLLVTALQMILSIWNSPVPLNNALTSVFVGIGCYALTRLFRGDLEGDAPRPRWRMTGRPTAGFLLGLYFLASGIVRLWTGYDAASRCDLLPLAALGLLYLYSSVRLVREEGFRPHLKGSRRKR